MKAGIVSAEVKWFDTNHLRGDLKGHSIRGGFSTIAGQIFSFILSISSTILMARLLLPDDYGLVAMVTAVTGFVAIFNDLGLSAAVIQKSEINQQQVSAIFWINVLISLGIAFIIALLAPVLVNFYHEPRLLNITLVFAISIFLSGLSLQHNALMKRQMQFKRLSLIQIGSTAASLLIGLLMAWQGFGYWAIIATMVLIPVFTSISLWIVCDWRPSMVLKEKEVNSFLKFGAGMTGFDLVNYFSRNMDNVLIGKYVGPAALGFYSKAYQLLMLPITQLRNPLNAVALPALSSLNNSPDQYRSFFKRYLFTLAFFCMPLVMYCGIFSEELILIILGKQWAPAAIVFKILAIASFIQPVASTQGLVLITTGRSKRYFLIGLVNSIVVVIGFYIGVQWGMEGVAISYAVVMYLGFIPFLYFSLKDSPMNVGLFLKEISFPGIFALIAGVAMYFFKMQFINLQPILLCGFGFVVGGIAYLAPWFSNANSKKRITQIVEMILSVKNKKLKK
jgi:PST family polysaccharide transporter